MKFEIWKVRKKAFNRLSPSIGAHGRTLQQYLRREIRVANDFHWVVAAVKTAWFKRLNFVALPLGKLRKGYVRRHFAQIT